MASTSSTTEALPATIPGLISRAARLFGPREAIVDGDLRLTFSGLHAAVETTARGLLARGIDAGDRVAIWSPNTHHWIVAALAAQTVGATLVTVNTRFSGPEAIDVLGRSGARLLVVPDRFLGRDALADLRRTAAEEHPEHADAGGPVPGLPALATVVLVPLEGDGPSGDGVIAWDALLAAGADVPAALVHERAAAVAPDTVADILFTSGTTGRPKGVMSSQRQTIAVADAWAERAEVTEDDRYIVITPFFHTFGYKAGFVVCLLRGATVVPQMVFDLDDTLDTVTRERITILPGPPTIYQSILDHPNRDAHDIDSLRLAVTGAAAVPVRLVERMRDELRFDSVLTAYGLSEAVVVTMCERNDPPTVVSHTAGRVTAGCELRIVDGEGRDRPGGEDGEILVRGATVMLGYLDDPDATAAAIDPDGWLHTGDVGHVDDGGHLVISDRIKDMFTVGGFNVYPAEVENALMRHPAVGACAVIGVDDHRMGQVGYAFVVLRADADATADEIVTFVRGRLANFKVPRTLEIVPDLPRNASGKVLKDQLRAVVPHAGASA